MNKNNPLYNFSIDESDLQYVGYDLQRPECILAEKDGSLWAADARGGVVHIKPDGTQSVITQKHDASSLKEGDRDRFFAGTLPNGLAFTEDGDILISNFGTDCLEIMKRTGETRVLLDSIDGMPIGKVNFVLRDSLNRIWITVTTQKKNWIDALVPDLDDGYIILYEEGKEARIVADGLHFTNEVRFDKDEEYLYCVETVGVSGGRIVRFRCEDGELKNKEVFGPERWGPGAYPDGIAFDSYGNLWGTMVYSDKIFIITPEGEGKIIFDAGDQEKVKALDDAFYKSEVDYDTLFATGKGPAPWMASITFGGKDLKNVYVGSLRGTKIPYFRSPVAGLPMVHW
ncbi:MAG TPA: SMP-30/gluconolactonase/LRE family protein [Clostridiaceae bacterium]|nr:SMP-30/gluconolactonase/LRE family protein [Clostridiaceae bacterium]